MHFELIENIFNYKLIDSIFSKMKKTIFLNYEYLVFLGFILN